MNPFIPSIPSRNLIASGLLALTLCGNGGTARAVDVKIVPTAPTGKGVAVSADAKKTATAAVTTAIANLTKEVNAHKKDPAVPLRAKSNYFVENKSPDATAEEILNQMGRSLGSDSTSDAYIKWQLLSGIEGKVDAKLAPKLISVYRGAPALSMRPGLETADKRQLDQLIQRAGQNQASRINEEFQKRVDEVVKGNVPIVVYLDDVYAHIPGSGAAILAGIQDGMARAGRGVDAGVHMKGVLAQITTWSVSASPQEVREVAGLLRQLVGKMGGKAAIDFPGGPKYAAGERVEIYLAKAPGGPPAPPKPAFPPSYYMLVEYDDKSKHLMWKEGAAGFADPKTLAATVAQLDEVATTLAAIKK